jgi:hypothetical protein
MALNMDYEIKENAACKEKFSNKKILSVRGVPIIKASSDIWEGSQLVDELRIHPGTGTNNFLTPKKASS